MRRTAWILCAVWLVTLVPVAAADPAAPIRLTILGTSDFHGALEARYASALGGRKVGGIDILAAYVQALRNTNPQGTLVLDAGDLYQGTLLSVVSEGRAVIDFYNDLGYDAVAVGNHEFDFGPVGSHNVAKSPDEDPLGALRQRMAESRFPFLSANLFDRATDQPWRTPNFKPYTLLRRQGVTVAVIGLTTPQTPEATYQSNVRGLQFRPMLASLRSVLPEVRAQGATVVILLAHAGVVVDKETGEVRGEVADLARALEPGEVDLIISGHVHSPFAGRINGIPVMQSWPHGISFSRADLVVDPSSGRVLDDATLYDNVFFLHKNLDGSPVRFAGQTIRPLGHYSARLAMYRRDIEHLQKKKLGRVESELLHRSSGDSAVGNLITDAMRAADSEIEIAMYNSGGLRTSIPRGDITYGRMFEVMPFDSYLMKVSLTGAQIREIVEHGLASDKGVMQISGLRVVYDPGAPPNRRCVGIQTQDGAPLRDERVYTVGTNDFVLDGGDGYYTFYRGTNVRSLDFMIRQAVTDYIRRRKTVQARPAGRYLPSSSKHSALTLPLDNRADRY